MGSMMCVLTLTFCIGWTDYHSLQIINTQCSAGETSSEWQLPKLTSVAHHLRATSRRSLAYHRYARGRERCAWPDVPDVGDAR
jgi:hypothetical protein